MNKKNKTIAITLAAGLGISTFGIAGQSFLAAANSSGNGEAAAQLEMTLEEARAAALAEVDGEIVEEEAEQENGTTEYEFDIISSEDGIEYEIEINQAGEVLIEEEDEEKESGTEEEDDEDENESA